MAYTPELSQRHSGTLRRIAWALAMPMTTAIEEVFDQIVNVMDRKMVCKACKDRSFCNQCVFSENSQNG
jgi:recombinational DNA repair protein RecR